MKRLLLFIKRVFYKIGIDISFVRKEEHRTALEWNDVDSMNKAWSDQKLSQAFTSKSVLERLMGTLSILEDHAIDLTGKSVIDVGCGTGMLLKCLSEKHKISSQAGMEYAAAAIELAEKSHPGPEYIVHDINLPYPGQFDAVFCTEVLEHILYPGPAFRNLLQMVRDGGILFATVPNGRVDTFFGHINFWSPESWDAFIMENSGGLRYTTKEVEKNLLYAIIYK
jgi:2-polyprenyl-3-methyl-5-hydroxy-6-metoxy-1,4-benzoquinol methylase